MFDCTIIPTDSIARRHLVAEPALADLMRDPITLALMAADRVDRRELDAVIAGARRNLRWHHAN